MQPVRVGMLGSGFIGELHALGLWYGPKARVVADDGAGPERREACEQRARRTARATAQSRGG
jgi:hypothetical protein